MIRDRNIDWLRKHIFIEAYNMNSAALAAGTPDIDDEISDFNLGSPIMAADSIMAHVMMVPYDADPEQEMGFTVVYTTGSSTTADDIDWIVLFELTAVGGVLDEPAGALDTVVAGDLVTGAWQVQRSPRGIKNAGWATRAQVAAGAMMMFSVELNATDAAEDHHLLGLDIDYAVRMTNS